MNDDLEENHSTVIIGGLRITNPPFADEKKEKQASFGKKSDFEKKNPPAMG